MGKECDPTWVFTEGPTLGAGWEHRDEVAVIVQVRGEGGQTRVPGERSGGI